MVADARAAKPAREQQAICLDSGCAQQKVDGAEDAPLTSAAYRELKWDEESRRYKFRFKYPNGKMVSFQTTVNAANNSKADAERICRLCYAQFESGASKDDVMLHRVNLYQQLTNKAAVGSGGSVAPQRGRPAVQCSAACGSPSASSVARSGPCAIGGVGPGGGHSNIFGLNTPAKQIISRVLIPMCPDQHDLLADVSWHFEVIYPALRLAEAGCGVRPDRCVAACGSTQAEVGTQDDRAEIVDTVMSIHEQCGELKEMTLFLAVQIVDRLLAQQSVRPQRRALIGATALLIAANFEDGQPPDHIELVTAGGGKFTGAEVALMEIAVLERLCYRLHMPTAAHHLEGFHMLNGGGKDPSSPRQPLVWYLAEVGLSSPHCGHWAPSHHAVAAVLTSNLLLQRPVWPPLLAELCISGDATQRDAIGTIMAELWRLLHDPTLHHATFYKFATQEFDCIAPWAQSLMAKALDG